MRIDKNKFNKIKKFSPFLKLSDLKGKHKYFHRKKGEFSNIGGVYFWGVTLNDKFDLPVIKDDLVIMYIGKSVRNIPERIMQEITQLVLGGFGNIPIRE